MKMIGTLKLDRFVLRVAFIVLLYLREGRKAFLVADKDTKGDTKVPCSDTQVLKGLETLINHKVIETKTIYDMFGSLVFGPQFTSGDYDIQCTFRRYEQKEFRRLSDINRIYINMKLLEGILPNIRRMIAREKNVSHRNKVDFTKLDRSIRETISTFSRMHKKLMKDCDVKFIIPSVLNFSLEEMFLAFPQRKSLKNNISVCTKNLDEQEFTVLKELLELLIDMEDDLKLRIEKVV